MRKWNVYIGGVLHEVIFGSYADINKEVRLIIDGASAPMLMTPVENAALFGMTAIEDSEIMLRLSFDGETQELIQDGISLNSMSAADEGLLRVARAACAAALTANVETVASASAQKGKSVGMSSFFTFVMLTYANILLMAVNAPLSFPFSACAPMITLSLGYLFEDTEIAVIAMIIALVAAVLLTTGYLVLYLLAKKRFWPIVTAFVLVLTDTALLVFWWWGAFGEIIIDIVFHAWVILSFIQLIRERKAQNSANKFNN